ncbi:transcriptional regulator with PAS, ATPase and Fis domain [Anaerobacterium chartisolvens]|uniref:Transcriptional regulator with PAS, ATPase and Fis domain n=1 Tax=Anaerobacterium chartisolvens TaxID=1297424 RepID=A0A369AKF5_9FIRM|nr:sigma 54-interacting transcriptional regulator [Anaerobacterium chartisolvens]RCX09583.1 transcriptional regulator with PAS, ATPase and Fis domain [Anaerobacterium chartisolvens]
MGLSVLHSIKDSVLKYAQVISTVLEMDVDIVDDQMIRIAGTEQFYKGMSKPIDDEGNAFKRVLQTQQTLVVENPGRDEVCLTCGSRFDCREEYEICCPVILDGSVIGVISLALFDKDKKNEIIKKQDNYVMFLEQISSLIAAKAAEYIRFQQQAFSVQLLDKLIDCISEGVIVFDQSKQILYINERSEQILGNNLQQLVYLKKINEFAIHKLNSTKHLKQVEYIVRIRSKKINLVGNIYPVMVEGREEGSVFIFHDISVLNRNLLHSQNIKNFSFERIIGEEDNFTKTKENAKRLAYSDVNLLISGETGTGKEIFARAIHNESSRKEKPFITIICTGSVESVIEKEIFGYEQLQLNEDERLGKLHLAQSGTLFIDEVGDLTPRLQGRLMQAIQNKRDYDVRIIASTSQDLKSKTESGEFRKDLYYSLIAFEISIPPVRSRPKDIPLLARYFLERFCHMEGKKITLSENVIKLMKGYSWPGNVREIEKIVNFIVNTQGDEKHVDIDQLPANIKKQLTEFTGEQYNLEKLEKATILQVLNAFGSSTDSKKRAAKELGIGVATLYRKLEKYGITEHKQYD